MAAKLKYEFKDSNLFRIAHVDGVFGGPTPVGNLYLSFFSERLPMPASVSYEFDGERIGSEILSERAAPSCTVERTMEVAMVMDINAAVYLRDWLTRQIETIKAGPPKPNVMEEVRQ